MGGAQGDIVGAATCAVGKMSALSRLRAMRLPLRELQGVRGPPGVHLCSGSHAVGTPGLT